MKIIDASVEEIIQEPGYNGLLKQIERGGRVCYKSEDKIDSDSAERFVNVLIKNKHYAPLEHGTVYLTFPVYEDGEIPFIRKFFDGNKYSYSRVVPLTKPQTGISSGKQIIAFDYVTTNYRVIVENDLQDSLDDYISWEPEEYHRLRKTFLITCDRGVSHELVRHRVMSFNQESTRYVNYSQDKWGKEITVIKPCFWKEGSIMYKEWKKACEQAEKNYLHLVGLGATPQEARSVLPNSVKTELLITGFVGGCDDLGWEHLLDLRCDKAAHPQAKEVADLIKEQLHK